MALALCLVVWHMCAAWQGKLEEAVTAAREATRSLQGSKDLRSFYAQLGLASSLAAQGQTEEARAVAEPLELVRACCKPASARPPSCT